MTQQCAECGEGMALMFVKDNPNTGIAYNVYACDGCLSICRQDVWKNAGTIWITGEGTISRGETIQPLVEMVRIEDVACGDWIRQGVNVWQVAGIITPADDHSSRILDLTIGASTYRVKMSSASEIERVQPPVGD